SGHPGGWPDAGDGRRCHDRAAAHRAGRRPDDAHLLGRGCDLRRLRRRRDPLPRDRRGAAARPAARLHPGEARGLGRLERLLRVTGPVATNVHILADARTREAIAIDTAIPSLQWIRDELAAREW